MTEYRCRTYFVGAKGWNSTCNEITWFCSDVIMLVRNSDNGYFCDERELLNIVIKASSGGELIFLIPNEVLSSWFLDRSSSFLHKNRTNSRLAPWYHKIKSSSKVLLCESWPPYCGNRFLQFYSIKLIQFFEQLR